MRRSPTTAALDSGTPVLTLSYVPAGGRAIALHCTPGSVTAVGAAIAEGPAGGMPSITSSAPAPTVTGGQPLLTASGQVLGILYDPDPASTPAVTFLPSDLVVGVADDLRSRDRVVHGWLGMSGADAPNGGGAKVESVEAHGPSANRLVPGDVIVAVNDDAGAHHGRAAGPPLRAPAWHVHCALGARCLGRHHHRGRHPERLPLACEGEHLRFGRPRQPDGGPPRRPAQGHRFGPGLSATAGSKPPAPSRSASPPTAARTRRPIRSCASRSKSSPGVAELHVAAATGITSNAGGISFEAVGPGQWSFRVLEAYRPVLKSMVEAQQQGAAAVPGSMDLSELDPEGTDGLGGLLGQFALTLGPVFLGMQFGSAAGHLARRAFGQYALPLPWPESSTLLLVPGNVARFADDWSLPLQEVQLWVCLRELTMHAVLTRPGVRSSLTHAAR